MIKVAEDTGKYPAYFWLAKILRSGKVSEKQGFVAFISKNGTIIKIWKQAPSRGLNWRKACPGCRQAGRGYSGSGASGGFGLKKNRAVKAAIDFVQAKKWLAFFSCLFYTWHRGFKSVGVNNVYGLFLFKFLWLGIKRSWKKRTGSNALSAASRFWKSRLNPW